jgi:hypothetical protein
MGKKKKKKIINDVKKEFLEKIDPLDMVNYLSSVMQLYIHTHWGRNKLEAKDLFVITKFFHLSISSLEGFSEEEVRDGMDLMNDMTHEEEFKYGCDLLEIQKSFSGDLKEDYLFMDEV